MLQKFMLTMQVIFPLSKYMFNMLIKLQLSRAVFPFSSCRFVTTFTASEFYKLLLITAILQMQYSSLQVWNYMCVELSFAQIWSFCRRKTAFAEDLMGRVKYIHKEKDNCLHCTNAGTMSPGPSQGPVHSGTAGFSQPTGTSSAPQGEVPTTQRGPTKSRDYRY